MSSEKVANGIDEFDPAVSYFASLFLVILKTSGAVGWSWVWVTCPIWIVLSGCLYRATIRFLEGVFVN